MNPTPQKLMRQVRHRSSLVIRRQTSIQHYIFHLVLCQQVYHCFSFGKSRLRHMEPIRLRGIMPLRKEQPRNFLAAFIRHDAAMQVKMHQVKLHALRHPRSQVCCQLLKATWPHNLKQQPTPKLLLLLGRYLYSISSLFMFFFFFKQKTAYEITV